MKLSIPAFFTLLLLLPVAAWSSPDAHEGTEQAQQALQDARLRALRRVFKDYPDAQQVLENATGYAVFARVGLNVGLASTQRIGGIVRHNRSGRDTYYQVLPAGSDEAAFIDDLAVILVLQSPAAFDRLEAADWAFPTLATEPDSAAGDVAGGVSLTSLPDVWVYQLTGALADLQGASLLRDEGLD
jgi:hypothetical protein